ncbi:amidohydrolase family protein [Nocardia sp. NBC_00565]|uniref:amidohydrolase family protein n=1 Tax=Nocardia sp. NBC_00565 TaxID=2975993 RepID=UPI002E8129E1|nr:amidohydrolase family protein [Nocardia sp. NBC_00565]WUC07079.1 amidohydrolase family protein [Nocardia sp. NBC_00565]
MIIDAHSHVHDPLEDHIALLDEAGVDKTVLFMTRPHPERARDLSELRKEMDRLRQALAGGGHLGRETARRELDAALTAYPDRFIGFASVPLDAPDVAGLVDRDVAGRGLRGIGELTPPPDRAALIEPVLRAATDHDGLPVVVHGAAPTTASDLQTLADLARRYPRVPLVVSQLGGAHWMDAIELVRDTPNMYLELSTASIVFAVRLAIAEIPERTLFGSDAPYGDPVIARLTVERATRSPQVRELVLGGTVQHLLT